MSLTHPLVHHHACCDRFFSDMEASALAGNWGACSATAEQFREEMAQHFCCEENLLFPAFEAATGMTGGPTQVMRAEHEQMRGLIDQLWAAVGQRDGETVAGAAQTLLILMQQHNMKEENILYPMCDQCLSGDETLAEKLADEFSAMPIG